MRVIVPASVTCPLRHSHWSIHDALSAVCKCVLIAHIALWQSQLPLRLTLEVGSRQMNLTAHILRM